MTSFSTSVWVLFFPLQIPLINFPARKAIKLLTFGRVEVSWFWHVLIGVGVLTVVTVVAIAVPQLK